MNRAKRADVPGAPAEHQGDGSQAYEFRPYGDAGTTVPITQVTPRDGYYVHTYYDVCPFSPSGRYLAATRLPYQDRIARLGDLADVCLIDFDAQTIKTVYSTQCWGFQVGAGLNWGSTDRYLYTNDVKEGRAVCVRLDLEGGEPRFYAAPMGHVASDETSFIGYPLELRNVTQQGYGMPSRDPSHPETLPPGAAKDEGIWSTDIETGQKRLLISLSSVAEEVPEPPPEQGGTYYFWHSKLSHQTDRIMVVLRCLLPSGHGGRNPMVFTTDASGGDIHFTPGNSVWKGIGGHPSWHPDGEHLIKNVQTPQGKRLFSVRFDGEELRSLSDTIKGGGHPTIEPTGRYVVTDAIGMDLLARRHVTIRLIDLERQQERSLCVMPSIRVHMPWDRIFRTRREMALRLDGHPVWNRDYTKVCFQAAPEGKRQLFIADLSGVL